MCHTCESEQNGRQQHTNVCRGVALRLFRERSHCSKKASARAMLFSIRRSRANPSRENRALVRSNAAGLMAPLVEVITVNVHDRKFGPCCGRMRISPELACYEH